MFSYFFTLLKKGVFDLLQLAIDKLGERAHDSSSSLQELDKHVRMSTKLSIVLLCDIFQFFFLLK